jgi:glycopeptide antibiotics resistance protein
VLTQGVEAEQLAVVWLLPAVVAIAALLLTRGSRTRTRDRVRLFVGLLAFGYLVATVAITFWPFQVDLSPERVLGQGNWIPFRGTLGFVMSDDPLRVRLGTRDFLANVVLFFPLGLLFGVITRRWVGLLAVFIVLVAVAVGLELVQGVTIAQRTLDVDDAIACAAGAFIGVAAAAVLRSPGSVSRG